MSKKPITIGLDARMFSDAFTGIGRYNYELSKRLFKQTSIAGQPLQWVIFLNDPQFTNFEFPENVKKIRVNAGHYSLSEQIKFLYLLYKERCDLVHFTHFNLPLLYGRSFLVTIHDTTISFYPGKKMNAWWRKLAYKLVIRRAVNGSKQIITVSRHTKQDVMKLFKTSGNKISPIHIAPAAEFKPLPPETYKQTLAALDITSPFLLYTGNWREHKNLVGLIKAFSYLKQKPEHTDLTLVITGKSDPYYPEVKDTIEALNLESAIKLVGLVDLTTLIGLFNAATVYVCPSFYEGFGLPPLEAMACATPVAVSEAASLPEVCGAAAVYFDPHDPQAMADKIETLLADETLQSELKEKGLVQAASFDWETTAKATFTVYEKILSV